MAVLRNTAEGQSTGTNLTAANSGGGSGDAFSNVATSGTVTKVFSNNTSKHGSQSYALTVSASSSVVMLWDVAGDSSGAIQAYAYFTAYPDSNNNFMSCYVTGNSAVLAINNLGRLLVRNRDAVTIDQSANNSVPLNAWVRFDLCATVGTGATDGRIQAAMSASDTESPIYTYDSGFTTNTGTAAFTSYRFGKTDGAPSIAQFYLDSLAADSGATTMIPPPTTAPVAWFTA